jgi:hypothetical protein
MTVYFGVGLPATCEFHLRTHTERNGMQKANHKFDLMNEKKIRTEKYKKT